jgi:predicted signal transduction protein with EAL and GGDEF domain
MTPPGTADTAPAPDAAMLQAMARRVLDAVALVPVPLPGGGTLRVTASVGYACFPLPPDLQPLSLDRAINLVDMALYTAKNQGRNNATGIVQAQAHDAAALQLLELDFDLARHEGRVLLERLNGPPAPEAGAGPGQAAEARPQRLPA